MKNFCFVGVDVSKKKLDICVISESKILKEGQVANHPKAIASEISSMKREFGIDDGDFIVCAEHTGQYTYPLVCACKSVGCELWLEDAAQIKYSSGVTRGKNDRVDARRIAEYAMRFIDKARPYERPTEELVRIKQMEAERSQYLVDKAKYQSQLTDQKEFMEEDIFKRKAKRLKNLIKYLEGLIKGIDEEIRAVVASSEKLARQMRLLQSVDGVGPKVALNMIIATEAFTRFDNPRTFCCYVGVAPFSYTSGSSVRSGSHVSQRAVKFLKSLLHMAAVSILSKKSGELKAYFERKTVEGKNTMSVLNTVRAKIVARMFVVIRRNQSYQPVFSV